MKILITGATGLIGTELVQLLLQNNHHINYLTTSTSKIVNEKNFNGFYWNPTEGKIDENCLLGVEVIIHLAGASIAKRWTNDYKQELIESRVVSANLLFNTLKKNPHQVKHIISASGTAIYPDSFSQIYSEDSKDIDDSFLGNLVVKWEESVVQFNLLNIKTTVLRTGIVFSEKGGALPEIVRPIKYYAGSDFGSGKQLQSWIHLTDLVNLYNFVINNQVEGIVNGVAPNAITNHDLTVMIAKIVRRPLFLPNIPQWFMKLILGEMSSLLFTNKNIKPQRALNLGFTFKYDTTQKALQDILK
ncbi:MAG: TIGR01777 family protein [Flavobacterium sp.]|nr:TIGR01777 family protein [Flavobacterium sp.]